MWERNEGVEGDLLKGGGEVGVRDVMLESV